MKNDKYTKSFRIYLRHTDQCSQPNEKCILTDTHFHKHKNCTCFNTTNTFERDRMQVSTNIWAKTVILQMPHSFMK